MIVNIEVIKKRKENESANLLLFVKGDIIIIFYTDNVYDSFLGSCCCSVDEMKSVCV